VGVAQEWPCIIAPSLPYGCKSQCRSGGGNHFCGTTSLDASTFIAQLVDIIRELARHGARKLGLVDIHYENEMYVLEACDLAIRELRYAGVLDFRIIRPIATALLNLDLLTPFYPEGFSTIALEHAGKLETSIMLYLQPELVAQDRFPENIVAKFPPYDAFPPETRHVPPSGALCPTSGACRELGEVVIKDIVRGYVNSFQKGFSEQ
jgi:creatinine amidohydrolase